MATLRCFPFTQHMSKYITLVFFVASWIMKVLIFFMIGSKHSCFATACMTWKCKPLKSLPTSGSNSCVASTKWHGLPEMASYLKPLDRMTILLWAMSVDCCIASSLWVLVWSAASWLPPPGEYMESSTLLPDSDTLDPVPFSLNSGFTTSACEYSGWCQLLDDHDAICHSFVGTCCTHGS